MRRLTTLAAIGTLMALTTASASASTVEGARSAELAYYGITAVGLLEAANPEAILAKDINASALTGSPAAGAYTATTATAVATRPAPRWTNWLQRFTRPQPRCRGVRVDWQPRAA